jgi:hypothetical protein
MICNGKSVTGGAYSLEGLRAPDDDPGHDHPLGNGYFKVGQMPGPGDYATARQAKKTFYEISHRGAFAAEKTPVGYRIRQLNGEPLSNLERAQARETVRYWNRQVGGPECRVSSCSN